jgi:GT2 family glycosyltransferase
MLRISVVVITRNRSAELEKCCRHVRNQTTQPHEIIVVDNSTDERTQRLIPTLFDVKYLRVAGPLGYQPVLRNEGIKASSGEIVAFLDDDGYAEPRWIEELAKCYDEPDVGGAGGRIMQGDVVTSKDIVGRFRLFGGVEGNWNYTGNDIFPVAHLQGTNMSFRRSVLLQIGGWDEAFCGGYATFEEPDVCLRVTKAGYRILFNPNAVVVHGEARRENQFGRSVNESPRLAYYTGRNGTYLYLKNLGFSPRVIVAALAVNPAIEIARCLFGSARKPMISKLSWRGALGALLHIAGVLRGVFLSVARFAGRNERTFDKT